MRTYFLSDHNQSLKGKPKMVERFADREVRLYQRGLNRFSVVYGLQVNDELDYATACAKLGQALMHSMACDGQLDSRMPGAVS